MKNQFTFGKRLSCLVFLASLSGFIGNSLPAQASDLESVGDRNEANLPILSVAELDTLMSLEDTDVAIDPITPMSQGVELDASPDSDWADFTADLSIDDLESVAETDTMSADESLESIDFDRLGLTDNEGMSQITSVNQLADVRPTDWAYQALQSLVERYGCIAGYPDGTFRGNNFLTRYEFAAGLNACLDRINELFASGLDIITQSELAAIQRLQEEFAAELATLRGRVDSLEARTAELEANQFSTTTKLFGQFVLGLQGRNNYDFDFFLDEFENDSEPNIITNAQLSFLTQFDDRSLLLVGLQGGDGGTNTTTPGLNTFTGLGYEGDTDHDLVLSDLSFRHLIGDSFAFIVGPEGVNAVNTFRGTNRVESAGFGPLSRFAQRNPIISIGSGSGGAGFDWQIANRISLQAVYSTNAPEDPDEGIFGDDNAITTAAAQLVLVPFDQFDISFQYVNSYSPFGRLFTGIGDDQLAVLNGATGRAPIQTNAVGTSLEWRVSPRFTAGGWFGYTHSDLLGRNGSVETINWMTYLNFPDLFGEGNLGGLYFGQPPRITDSDLPDGRNVPSLVNEGDIFARDGDQPDASYHLEGFYRWRLNDHISLTPGVIVVFNPGHNANNDTVVIGALRTTFSF